MIEATAPAPLDSASLADEDFPDEPGFAERQENHRHASNDTIISPVNSTTYQSLIPQSNAPSTIPAESSLSSSNHFGRRVEEVLANSGCMSSRNSGMPTSNPIQADDMHHSLRTATQNSPSLPTEDEAFRLLDAASLFIGQSQTHYDLREISDRVGILYQNINDPAKPGELWYLQIILIFAVGKLYAAGLEKCGQTLPGKELFEFTERNFPPISVQFNSGRIGVEINAMMAMYLQMTNRKDEAHLYVRPDPFLSISLLF